MLSHYFDLYEKSSNSMMRMAIDGDEDDNHLGTNNDAETALEREIQEEAERDQARLLELI